MMKPLGSNFYPYPVIPEIRIDLPSYNTDLKYCHHASDEFNARMDSALQRLSEDAREAMADNLVALILGGGYGHGEGGVIRLDGYEQPCDDLDLTLIVEDKSAVQYDQLAAISKKYESELKIRVDFSRPLTIEDIRNWPRSLMWQDLLNGHIVLYGQDDALIANAPPSLRDALPLIEATRLLLNRGAALLRAMRIARGVESAPNADFVRRNYFQCGLALGDAALIAHRRYATPYRGRDERLAALASESDEVAALNIQLLYEISLLFKFAPDQSPDVPLTQQSLQILARLWGATFLHIESKRAGRGFRSLEEYSRWFGLREPQQHTIDTLARNVIRNIQIGTLSWLYPREWLYRRLPVLLGLTHKDVGDWAAESERFLVVWERFN